MFNYQLVYIFVVYTFPVREYFLDCRARKAWQCFAPFQQRNKVDFVVSTSYKETWTNFWPHLSPSTVSLIKSVCFKISPSRISNTSIKGICHLELSKFHHLSRCTWRNIIYKESYTVCKMCVKIKWLSLVDKINHFTLKIQCWQLIKTKYLRLCRLNFSNCIEKTAKFLQI